MLKQVCLGLLSLCLVLPSHASSFAKLLTGKHHQAKSFKAKSIGDDIEIVDYSGRWVGDIEGDELELVIKQSFNNIEINNEVYEFNSLNSKSLASFDMASHEHSLFEKQADGSIVFSTISIEKFYFEKGLIEDKVHGQMMLQGEKLILKFEAPNEAPFVIEFRKV